MSFSTQGKLTMPILGLLLLFPLFSQAQLNLEAGYSYSFFKPDNINSIVGTYEALSQNSSHSTVSGLHGMEIGANHHWSGFSSEVFWQFRRARNERTYESAGSAESLSESFVYTDLNFGIGIAGYVERFSIGSRLAWNSLKLKTKGNSELPEREIGLDQGLASQFYISYSIIDNGSLRVKLKPFYQLNWYESDLSELSSRLGVNGGSAGGERMSSFGITLIFANGPKPY